MSLAVAAGAILWTSIYYYGIDNVYAFALEYCVCSPLIGFLIASVLYLKVRKDGGSSLAGLSVLGLVFMAIVTSY